MTLNLNTPTVPGSRTERWRRHALAFVAAAGVVLLVGSYIAFLAIPNQYRAETVLATPRADASGIPADLAGPAVLEAAATRLGLAGPKDTPETRAAAGSDLGARIDVKTRPAASGQTEVVISARGADAPETLAGLVNAVAATWRAQCEGRNHAVEEKAGTAASALAALKKSAADARRTAADNQAALMTFESEHVAEKADAGSDPEAALKSLGDEAIKARSDCERTQAEIAGLQDAEKLLRARLKEVPETVTTQEVTTVRNPQAVRLEHDIEQKQRQLDDMLKMYTFRHPEVIALQTDLLQMKRQLEALEKRVDDSVKSSKAPNPEYAVVKGKLDDAVVRQQVAKTSLGPLAGRRDSTAARYERLRTYVEPHRRLVMLAAESSRSLAEKETEIAKAEKELHDARAQMEPVPVVTRPAAAPDRPVGPSRGLYAALAVIAAVVAGAFSVSAAVRLGPGFAGPAEAERFAGAPVIAEVGAAKDTEAEASARIKSRLYVAFTLGAALAAVLAACLMAHFAGR